MLGSRTRIYTPEGYTRISRLKANDKVISWDGSKIRIVKIQQVVTHNYEMRDLYKFHIEHVDKKVLVSKDHVFWLGAQHMSIADSLKYKEKVIGIDSKKVKIIGKEAVINENQVKKYEKTKEGYLVMYELKLHEKEQMYFFSNEKVTTFSYGSHQ